MHVLTYIALCDFVRYACLNLFNFFCGYRHWNNNFDHFGQSANRWKSCRNSHLRKRNKLANVQDRWNNQQTNVKHILKKLFLNFRGWSLVWNDNSSWPDCSKSINKRVDKVENQNFLINYMYIESNIWSRCKFLFACAALNLNKLGQAIDS